MGDLGLPGRLAGRLGELFSRASIWADSFDLDLAWSPLYSILYGSMQWVIDGAFDVTITHRVLIALGAALLVLAVLRRLLSPAIAWALAIWWVLLPTNFDTVYEVHLFAVLLPLVAVVVALTWSGPWMRSAVLAILVSRRCSFATRPPWPPWSGRPPGSHTRSGSGFAPADRCGRWPWASGSRWPW